MIRPGVFYAAIFSIAACGQDASAAGGDHGTKPVNLSDTDLAKLANQPGRVGGYYVNSNDWFYFVGDTAALNSFLEQYAELNETPHILVIHPGKAPAETCVGDRFDKSYDWKLDSMWPAFTREKQWFENPDGGRWQRAVIVHAWLSGNIRLDRLEVPASIQVRPGGEIESFINEHNKKSADRAEAGWGHWGQAVNGIQCRLRPRKSSWNVGEPPQLEADLRNRGTRERSMELYPTSWDVEYDGVWYRATAIFSGGVELLRLNPGGQRNGISLLLEDRFAWLSKKSSERLVFEPGRHTLRAAFKLDGVSAPVVSNTVEIEILSATNGDPASTAESSRRQRDVVPRGASLSCRHLCLDIDEDSKVEGIGGATSSRCLRLAEGKAPDARWRLTETEHGHLIQAQSGRFDGWYLDFDDDARIEEMGGATSSRNLLLTQEIVPGAYWKVTETDEGFLIQAQAGRFDGWYLNLDMLTRQEVEGAFWQIEIADGQAETDPESGPLVIDLIRAEGNMRETPSFWIGYEQLSEDALRRRAKQLVKASPRREAVLRAGRDMPREHVADLLELLKAVGAKDVSLSVFPLASIFAIDQGPGRDGTIRGKVIGFSTHRGRPVNCFVTLENEAWNDGGERPCLEVAPGDTFEFRNVPAGQYKVRAQPITDSKQDAVSVAKPTEVEVVVKNKEVVEILLPLDRRQPSAPRSKASAVGEAGLRTALAFVDVAEKLTEVRTATCRMYYRGTERREDGKFLVAPGFARFELSDGQVLIEDHRQRKCIRLNPDKRLANVWDNFLPDPKDPGRLDKAWTALTKTIDSGEYKHIPDHS